VIAKQIPLTPNRKEYMVIALSESAMEGRVTVRVDEPRRARDFRAVVLVFDLEVEVAIFVSP